MLDIPNDNNIPPTDDDDKYSESSEGENVDIHDKEINNNPNNMTIPAEKIFHLGPYLDHPEDDRRSDAVYWVTRFDIYVLSALLDNHIKDGPYADVIATSHISQTTFQFGFNCGIREFR